MKSDSVLLGPGSSGERWSLLQSCYVEHTLSPRPTWTPDCADSSIDAVGQLPQVCEHQKTMGDKNSRPRSILRAIGAGSVSRSLSLRCGLSTCVCKNKITTKESGSIFLPWLE